MKDGGGGGGCSFSGIALFNVILSAGRKSVSVAIQVKPFEQHMTLFIYLILKWNLE